MQKSSEELAAYYAAIPDFKRRAQRQSVVKLGIQSTEVTNGLLALRTMLDDLETALKQTPLLTGAIYGLADAALTPFVSRLAELRFEWMWTHLPYPGDWWNRVQERASFETVFTAYPNPERKLGMQQAGKEAREEAIRILAIK